MPSADMSRITGRTAGHMSHGRAPWVGRVWSSQGREVTCAEDRLCRDFQESGN